MFSVSNPISSIHCQRTDNCSYYTYFLEADPYSQLCILLSSLIEPLQPCDSCVTGPVDCDDRDECSLNVDDERVDHKMFTAGVNITLNIHGDVITRTTSIRFAMVLPPPNVTGVLHLGHALTATVQDSLV